MTSESSSSNSNRLYRIMDFARVVQIFEREELYFASPTTWDDPYEQRIKHQKSHALFAQCWCQLGISDAMWRIYSQNGLGVRISTTKAKLKAIVKEGVKSRGYRWRGCEVEYMSQSELNVAARNIAQELRSGFDITRAADMLYLKRDAFRHESEWRATLYCPDQTPDAQKKGITVQVDPHNLIDRILLDPRAPDELVSAFKFYFKRKLKFQGDVVRSVLYKSPKPIEVDDEQL
ncbi:conserved hypothetical protein [Cupriavidus taiwanensis]|uniref:DUF2971 domain-containing protein n=1 Tax=Cupriavidus taiwanensis TaxID=164546 RepID=UPI000E156031|nr:DUF2971 domain-containing protein [Cupriavidus taiwanensis]SOZ14444.1 conserved hypothetical protein [Cupriavidus taiwanensis]SOZ25847.1 conserved hypothetical protein [Cupriavidus taiwanensis]SOZ45051.1 conserved hypothetical protein [Cupriavidus taiwanensis]